MEDLLHQFYCFLLSIACGAFLTLCYLLLCGLRYLLQIKGWLVAAGDLLFWAAAAVFCFLVIFRVNQGEIRIYMLLGSLAGTLFILFIGKGLKNFTNRVKMRKQKKG